MMCYRDMTFCPYYAECASGADCRRALTPIIQAEAREWMGDNAPVCVFAEKPDCYKES